jgi:Tfp pilus assembly protein PilF
LHLDPNLPQAHLNLGFAYEQLNQMSLAEHEYRRACELNADLCEMIKRHQH